jgi:chemotaxis protein methyltransferase CheR
MPVAIIPAISGSGPLEIGEREFRLLREIIQRETGIQLKDAKRSLVASRVGKRLRCLGLSTYGEYYDFLQGSGGAAELRELINCITTNKTSFFREDAHFAYLREWLPRVAARSGTRPLRIWSAASSTGEEAYTIAMTALDVLGGGSGIRILASDIDTEVLETGRKAIYPAASLDSVPAQYKRRHFLRGVGEWEGYVQVKRELQSLVEFRQFNLIQRPWTMSGRFDAIFLRNVVIYFDRETQRGIFERLALHLEPHGLLFVGSSESLFWLPELYSPVSHAVYRLKDADRGGV